MSPEEHRARIAEAIAAQSEECRPMTYEEAKAQQGRFIAAHEAAARTLKALPGVGTGRMGLTPDAVKFGPEYRAAQLAVDCAFAALRQFNRWYCRTYREEIRADRAAQIARLRSR